MLHYETIDPKTLELLRNLLKIGIFKDMRLAGGTSLALQIGHRKSIDLEIFGDLKADDLSIVGELHKIGTITILKKTANIKVFLINGIKVDIVNYKYPWLQKVQKADELRLAAVRDIIAMKLAAVTGRGMKKYFFDLYFLLKNTQLKEMLNYYNQKFFDGSEFLVLKSLTYFADADEDEEPVMLIPVDWSEIKDFISQSVVLYLKSKSE